MAPDRSAEAFAALRTKRSKIAALLSTHGLPARLTRFRMLVREMGAPQWAAWDRDVRDAVLLGAQKRLESDQFLLNALCWLNTTQSAVGTESSTRTIVSLACFDALCGEGFDIARTRFAEKNGAPTHADDSYKTND